LKESWYDYIFGFRKCKGLNNPNFIVLKEKEINLLRNTHSNNMLQSTDGSTTNNQISLGKSGKEFKFSHLPNKVSIPIYLKQQTLLTFIFWDR